jgi:hypothetical protein
MDTELITLASFHLLFAWLSHPHKLQVISPGLCRCWFGEFKNCRVYSDSNIAIKSLSDERNITAQFLIILTLYFTGGVLGIGQFSATDGTAAPFGAKS